MPDNRPKLVLSLDTAQPANRDGIRWQNLVDFLLETRRRRYRRYPATLTGAGPRNTVQRDKRQ